MAAVLGMAALHTLHMLDVSSMHCERRDEKGMCDDTICDSCTWLRTVNTPIGNNVLINRVVLVWLMMRAAPDLWYQGWREEVSLCRDDPANMQTSMYSHRTFAAKAVGASCCSSLMVTVGPLEYQLAVNSCGRPHLGGTPAGRSVGSEFLW